MDDFSVNHLKFKWALKNISFEVKAGATVALVGPSGTHTPTHTHITHSHYYTHTHTHSHIPHSKKKKNIVCSQGQGNQLFFLFSQDCMIQPEEKY